VKLRLQCFKLGLLDEHYSTLRWEMIGTLGTIPRTTSATLAHHQHRQHEVLLTGLLTEIRLLERVYYHCG